MEAKQHTQIKDDYFIDMEAFGALLDHRYLTQIIQDAKDKDLVVFLGLTASGKSTCINYLLDAKLRPVKTKGKNWAMLASKHHSIFLCSTQLPEPLEEHSLYLLKKQTNEHSIITTYSLDNESNVLNQAMQDSLKKIADIPAFPNPGERPIKINQDTLPTLFQEIISICGYVLSSNNEILLGGKLPKINTESYRSCTLYSQIFNDKTTKIAYCDTPGFMDTRKIEGARECASLSTQLVIQSAKNIKAILLVIEWNTFDSLLTTNLENLMLILSELLKSPYKDVQGSFIFLINRVPERMDRKDFQELVCAYQSEVEKNIAQMIHKLSTSKIDTMEFNKLNSIALMLNFLQLQLNNHPENVILMDVFDNGEKREAIRQLLLSKDSVIPKEKFNFGTYDEKRQRFDAELNKLAKKGSQLIDDYFTLCDKKEALDQSEGNIKANQAYYAALTNFLKANDEKVFACMKSELVELTKKEINRVIKEKQDCTQKITNLETKNRQWLVEKQNLDTQESTLIYEDTFHEPLSATLKKVMTLTWIEKFWQVDKRFVYPTRVPFLRYETIGNGKWGMCHRDVAQGICEINYTSLLGDTAVFRVFAAKRCIPANAARLAQIEIELPRNADKIKANQTKLNQLAIEENNLDELLRKTLDTEFETSEQQREATEKQFRAHFKSSGLSDDNSRIYLCLGTLPDTLEKGNLYLLKTVGQDGIITITAQVSDELAKVLSKTAYDELQQIKNVPAFPSTSSEPVILHPAQHVQVFQSIAAVCGYPLVDIKQQKNKGHRAITVLKEQIKQAQQAITEHQSGFKLMKDLSQFFESSPMVKAFLVHYQEYEVSLEKESATALLHAKQCRQQLEQFDVQTILYAKAPEDLESIQAKLESILQGVSDDTDFSLLKAQAFWSLCKAYQKKPPERSVAMVTVFNQFLDIANKMTLETVRPILQSLVFHNLCANPLNQPAVKTLLATYIKHFGFPAPDENGNTWLHEVVIQGNIPAVQLLLQNGFDITAKNAQGQTPFFLAALNKQPVLVKILLAQDKLDFKKRGELLFDASQNHLLSYLLAGEINIALFEIIEMLHSFGATFSLGMLKDSNLWHRLVESLTLEKEGFLDSLFVNPEKERFLDNLRVGFGHCTVRWDQTSIAFKLLTCLLQGLNPTERTHCLHAYNHQHETLLQFISHHYAQSPDRIKAILSLFVIEGSAMDRTVLATCIQLDQVDIMAFLLARWKSPLDLHTPLADGKTFLGLAIEAGQVKCVELLLNYQVNSNQPFSYSFSQPISHRKGFTTIADKTLQEELNLSSDFIIGTAVDDGGCFFDSFAQVVNALEGAPLHTEKSLREQCYQYYRQNPDQVEKWHQTDYVGTAPSYDNICYSGQSSRSEKVLWGRPQVEGMILCRVLDLDVVYVAEVMPNPDDSTELTVGYYKITPDAYQSTRKIEKPADSPFLVVSKNDLHFIPVLQPTLVSPLRLCVFKKQVPMLQVLLNAATKVSLRAVNEKGQTLFHTAALMGDLLMLKTLESKLSGSDKWQWLTDTDTAGNTVFMLTIKHGHTACMQWVVEICETYGQGQETGEKSFYWESILQKSNQRGQTAMTIAIKNQNLGAVQFCFTKGSASFWKHETEGNKVLEWIKSNNTLSQQTTEQIRQSKIAHSIELVRSHLEALLNQDPLNKVFLKQWLSRLEKVLNQSDYKSYQDALIDAPMMSVQTMAEQLAINMAHHIREKYHSAEYKTLLQNNVKDQTYHAWDQVLHTAITKTLSTVTEKNRSDNVPTYQLSLKKTDKHRAFTRALKEALRNYFYVSRALYEGKVLMNDEGFNAFKAAFNIASPIATEIGATLTTVNVGVIGTFVSAALELVTRLKDAKYQCEAGRFVQAFGLCQPDAIEKYEKDISIDHDKLKSVAEALYRRYRDQIQQCTVSKEAEISLRLAKTDGIYVLANIMADRIFQHMIKKGSVKVDDDRTITDQFLDWVNTLGANNDIYYELSLMSLPERCIMAILHETIGEDRDAHVRTDTFLKNGCKTEDIWMAGGILVKTGLKLESNSVELYVRKGNVAERSEHAKYGYCYLSESMINLKEIEKRNFVKAELVQVDQFADSLSETDRKALAACSIF